MSLQVQADLLLECGRRQDTVHAPNDPSLPPLHRKPGDRFRVDNVGPGGFATLIAAKGDSAQQKRELVGCALWRGLC